MYWGQRQSTSCTKCGRYKNNTWYHVPYDGKHVSRHVEEVHTECLVDQHLEDDAGTRVHGIP